MRPIVVAAKVHTETGKIWWEWECPICKVRGTLYPTLDEAERTAERHNRTMHDDRTARA